MCQERPLSIPYRSEKRNKMGTKLYVGNLSFNTMDTEIKNLFSQVGTVVSCDIILDKFTSKSRGFGFVEMSTQEEATKAIAEFNGKDLDGRALTVNEAKPREERPRGSFGGGGSGGGGRRDFGGGGGGGGRGGRR